MSQKFLRGHRPKISPRGSWRVTRISRGETLKISKWVSHHVFSQSRYLRNYLHFSNRMSKNQVIMIWRFWSTAKLEVEGSQPVGPKILKWVFHHVFSQLRNLRHYLQFSNQMSRNQDIVIWRFWSTAKLEVEGSQPVEPKISKWVFFHVFPLAHGNHINWQNWIWMSRTYFIIFRRSVICQW